MNTIFLVLPIVLFIMLFLSGILVAVATEKTLNASLKLNKTLLEVDASSRKILALYEAQIIRLTTPVPPINLNKNYKN